MMSRENEASLLGKSVLQSTFSDHPHFRPDLDISVIKGKRNKNAEIFLWFGLSCNFVFCSISQDRTVIENAVEPERNPENEKMIVEMETFLLAYLTAKVS